MVVRAASAHMGHKTAQGVREKYEWPFFAEMGGGVGRPRSVPCVSGSRMVWKALKAQVELTERMQATKGLCS